MRTFFVTAGTLAPFVEKLVESISDALHAGQRVLWLVSGGSVVAVEVAAMQQLAEIDCTKLTVMQVDERYGAVGHTESNWQRLLDAGFDGGTATCVPMLSGTSLEQTAASYESLLQQALVANTLRVGVFGIGADGHTAGILPGSVAARPTRQLVVGYEGPDFVRITLTPAAIRQLDLAVAYAVGEAKAAALDRLLTDVPVLEQPAQVLKQVNQAFIYNDHVEGTI